MKFGDSGNVITERLLNFTETFVCLERLDQKQNVEVSEATIMKRKSSIKTVSSISESPRKESLRSPARTKAVSSANSNPRTKVRSSQIKKKNGECHAAKSAAKRNLIQEKSKIPLSNVRKVPNRGRKSAKQANESDEGHESLRENIIAISSMQKVQTENLRECSIVLKTVHIPETVYLDAKTKRRLSSLFKASRKSGQSRSRVSNGDPEGNAGHGRTEPLDDLLKSEVDQAESSSCAKTNGRNRPSIGKRKRDETSESGGTKRTPPARRSNSQRRSSDANRGSKTTPRSNPAKRSKVSSRSSGQLPHAKRGSERDEEEPMLTDSVDRERSLSWDENPSQRKSTGEVLRDTLTSASESENGTLESNDSPAVSERFDLVPARYNSSDRQRGPQRSFVILQGGRCAHCSCSCSREEEPVDKNQPLITKFLRRTPKESTKNVGSDSNTDAVEGNSASLSEKRRRDSVNEESPSKSDPPEGESASPEISAEPQSKKDSASQPETTEEAPKVSEDHEVVNVDESIEEAGSLHDSPVAGEETCNESDRFSLTDSVKLVLEESSDDSVVNRSDTTNVKTNVTPKNSPETNEDAAPENSPETNEDEHKIPTDDSEAKSEISKPPQEEPEGGKKDFVDLDLNGGESQGEIFDITDELDPTPNISVEPAASQAQVPDKIENSRSDHGDDRGIRDVPNNTEEIDALEETDVVSSCETSASTKLDEPLNTASESNATQKKCLREQDENREHAREDTREPSALPDGQVEGNRELEGNRDTGVESERVAGILLNNGKESVSNSDGCEETCERSKGLELPTVPEDVLCLTGDHADDIADSTNEASSGTAVLCFLGDVSPENTAIDENLDVDSSLTPEAPPNGFSKTEKSKLSEEQQGIEVHDAVVDLPPIV